MTWFVLVAWALVGGALAAVVGASLFALGDEREEK